MLLSLEALVKSTEFQVLVKGGIYIYIIPGMYCLLHIIPTA